MGKKKNTIQDMNNLFFIYEYITNGSSLAYLNIYWILAINLASLIYIYLNPIISVLFLIGLFIIIAAYLISIGLNFIGIAYLLVYVGGVSILFLFILMLINVRIVELSDRDWDKVVIDMLIGNLLYLILSPFIVQSIDNLLYHSNYNIWDGNLTENSHITSIGTIMYTNYASLLIITSLILLLAMVGTIIITISKTKNHSKSTLLNSSDSHSFVSVESNIFSPYIKFVKK